MCATAADRTVRSILASEVDLAQPADRIPGGADLFDLGLDSHGAVRVMLALEDALGVVFPDDRLCRETFCSIDAIVDAVIAAGAPP